MEDCAWPEITVETPLEEVRAIHKRIWDYVIKNGEKPITPYSHNCVLCEYAGRMLYKNKKETQERHSICFYCPAKWTTNWCGSVDGLYYNWEMEIKHDNSEKAKEYGKQIRNIPFKEGIMND